MNIAKLIRRLLGRPSRVGDATAIGEATISARVYRAETGKWEDLGVVSKGAVMRGQPIRTNATTRKKEK